MLKIAIVEDQTNFAQQLQEYLAQYAGETGQEFKAFLFRDGADILQGYTPGYDMILMDIEMPKTNGMDVAKKIRAMDAEVVIVFITNMAQYAIHGYAVGALDYVLKPLSYGSFKTRFARALGRVAQHKDEQIVLDCREKNVRVQVRKIQYVEVQNRILCYHTEDGEYTLRGTLKQAEEQLARFHFVKGNYWYIVNLLHITEIGAKTLLVAGQELPVSRGNRAELMAAFNAYIGGVSHP